MRVRMIAGAGALAALVLAVGASAKPPGSDAASTVALQWNANAVAAVRAAPRRTAVAERARGRCTRPRAAVHVLCPGRGLRRGDEDRSPLRALPRFSPVPATPPSRRRSSRPPTTRSSSTSVDPSTLAAKYAASIAALPDDRTRPEESRSARRRRRISRRCGRTTDATPRRHADVGTPTNPVQPGVWVWPPPPSLQIAQTPWMAAMRPFMLKSTSQFRAPPPPALTSALYTTDFNETKAYGSNHRAHMTRRRRPPTSGTRTRSISSIRPSRTSPPSTTWTSSTRCDCWPWATWCRPTPAWPASTRSTPSCSGVRSPRSATPTSTATRRRPLIRRGRRWSTTPNHPEYPSQHGCVTSALAQVLAHALGTTHRRDHPGRNKAAPQRH